MSNLLNVFYNSQNQIIDVTKDCEFQWVQEPKSCYAYLQVSSASGDFSDGETVTGGTSNATATVFSSYIGGGRVYVENVSGTFQAGETISGSSSNQTATVDGFVAERSWSDNITHGSFPDSIISKDINDYLEWESTLPGSGNIMELKIGLSEEGVYLVSFLFGTGEQIDSIITNRNVLAGINCNDNLMHLFDEIAFLKSYAGNPYDTIFPKKRDIVFVSAASLSNCIIKNRQDNKGTFRWRIHNIRVLKLVI